MKGNLILGLSYLGNQSWWQVTRDERFFCQRLFTQIQKHGVRGFVNYLNVNHKAGLNPNDKWEAAYEVCFYRDLWHQRGKAEALFSPKRTFDLCLFSEQAIIIIEAKAQQKFDKAGLDEYNADKVQVFKETGVQNIMLMAIASSKYEIPNEYRQYFDGRVLTWNKMAQFYDNDAILMRADAVYEIKEKITKKQNNTDGKMSGIRLLEAWKRADGKKFYVGRQGGLNGLKLKEDIASGNWKTQDYETNKNSKEPPNSNWLLLSDFIERVSGE